MNLFKIFKINTKPFFYSLSLTLGIFVALQEIHEYKNPNRFFLFSLLILFIYLAEVFANWRSNRTKIEINLDINDEVNELSHLFHKLVLPIALYLSLIGFGYYNIKSISLIALLIAVFLTFFILFINIRSFFEAKSRLESKTHYVYDLIKFIIFFCLINFLSNTSNNNPQWLPVYALLSSGLSLILLILMMWRINKLKFYSFIYSFISSICVGIVFLIYHAERVVNSLQISLGLFFVFYLASAIIHHLIMKTLTKGVLLEYVLVIFIVIAITYGIA